MKGKWLVSVGFITMFLIGCQSADQFSPEQVMEKALESEADETPYYGEMEMTIKDDEDTFTITSKEWHKGNQSLDETVTEGEKMITLKNGESVMIYDVAENVVMETEFAANSELNLSSKERLENMLELVGKTHTLEKKQDEQIAGRDAMHIVAEKNPGEKSIFGTQEIWIDKENWLVLKTIDKTEDSYSVMEYTTLEMDPNMSDDIFTLDLPDDVEVESLDDLNNEEQISLEEGIEKIGGPFMYLKETEDLTLEKITYFNFDESETTLSIDLSYHLSGLPYMELSVMEKTDDDLMDDDLSETIEVRGEEASYLDLDGAHMVTWIEGDFQYNAWFINPNMSMDEVKALLEEMEEIQIDKE